MSNKYILSFYEIDLGYGGPEEGGWYFETGNLIRSFKILSNKDEASKLCRRANSLLEKLQKNKREVSSVLYSGERHAVLIHKNKAPDYYPQIKPIYD